MIDVVEALESNPNADILALGKDLKDPAKAKFEKKAKLVKARVEYLKVIEEAKKITDPSKKKVKELTNGKAVERASETNSMETIESERQKTEERKTKEINRLERINERLEEKNTRVKEKIEEL